MKLLPEPLFIEPDRNVAIEGSRLRGYDKMVTEAVSIPTEEVKKPTASSVPLKSNAFERLPDEIIEQ